MTTAVRVGFVAETLLAEARDAAVDLTVLSTHGRGGPSRMWLGSVATGFVQGADRPVLLVPPAEPEGEGEDVRTPRKLLVPLDGSPLGERALEHAVGLGTLFGAGYHLGRVVVPPVHVGASAEPASLAAADALTRAARDAAVDYLEQQVGALRERGLDPTSSVRVDSQAGRGILRIAEEEGCDAIAMATHGRSGLSRALLGSTADKVARASRVPVLLVRAGTTRA